MNNSKLCSVCRVLFVTYSFYWTVSLLGCAQRSITRLLGETWRNKPTLYILTVVLP